MLWMGIRSWIRGGVGARRAGVIAVVRGTAALLVLSAVVVGVGPGGAAAQEGADHLEVARQARQLAGEIMSPFCIGRTLEDCPSPAAAAVREQLRVWLASGLTEDDIKARLDREFGAMLPENYRPTLASVPDGAVGWVVPILILIAGAALLVTVVVRLQRPAPQAPELSEQDRRRLEAELEAQLQAKR